MRDYELLGHFYLGKIFDSVQQSVGDDLLLYDSKDLTTHALCVGMTGSGKTGLCLGLLEEAAIDGIPAIIIDPKGDLGNLLLTFPQLRPEDFVPWVDPADATRQGLTVEQLAAKTAETWRDGLAQWGQTPERIARFRDASNVQIFTPGSNAGCPLTVLRSFDPPPDLLLQDPEAIRDRLNACTSGLLGLLGIDADPIGSREHILVSSILSDLWSRKRGVTLAELIHHIQNPPFQQVGVFDLETFYPAKDRMRLAMTLNTLLASPTFANWLEGESLNVPDLLYTQEGKPRLAIVSISHLNDAERMFFVTILLSEILAWIRTQPGTSSLRALLYMDEVFGYLPPTANPPSKLPMLTLLKQARAYGLGIVLATQNPVDLDYKALSNMGTWFLGRLQTERDKARVLDGLEGASAQTSRGFDRAAMDALLSGLKSRVFLMNNVHEDGPVLFQTRWTLSYLRGPMTREQIQLLTRETKQSASEKQPEAAISVTRSTGLTSSDQVTAARPVIGDLAEKFVPLRRPTVENPLVYRPALGAQAKLHYVNTKAGVDVWHERFLLAELALEKGNFWEQAKVVDPDDLDWADEPEEGAGFEPLPAAVNKPNVQRWGKDLQAVLYRDHGLTLWRCVAMKMNSQPDELQAEFRIRLHQAAHERRDLEVEKLRSKYSTKLTTIKGKIQTAQARIDREKSQYNRAAFDTAISWGTSILGAVFGRKLASRTNITKASTSLKSLGRAAEQHGDVGRAQEQLNELHAQLEELEAKFEEETQAIRQTFSEESLVLEEQVITPRKSDIQVEHMVLVWAPN